MDWGAGKITTVDVPLDYALEHPDAEIGYICADGEPVSAFIIKRQRGGEGMDNDLSIELIFKCTGAFTVEKAVQTAKKIKKEHPDARVSVKVLKGV